MNDHQKNNIQENGLYVPRKEVSWIVACILCLCFGMFIGGYFIGQRQTMLYFFNKIEEESFSDKITYSLYAMNGQDLPDEGDADEQPENAVTATVVKEKTEQTENENTASITNADEDQTAEDQEPPVVYYAPLVGFGTLRAADNCAQQLKAMGVSVQLVERSSFTPRGKKIRWYQLVTADYTDKEVLEQIVKNIKQKLNIRTIKIIEKRKVVYS